MAALSENRSPAAAATAEMVLAPGAPGLLTRSEGLEPAQAETEGDPRLDHLPMRLDVMVKVRAFRVQELLALEKGMVVESVQEHTKDVPVECGGALLMWAEFEMVGQKLAVRITRLA
jgi:flagellar motor switch protein FliN